MNNESPAPRAPANIHREQDSRRAGQREPKWRIPSEAEHVLGDTRWRVRQLAHLIAQAAEAYDFERAAEAASDVLETIELSR